MEKKYSIQEISFLFLPLFLLQYMHSIYSIYQNKKTQGRIGSILPFSFQLCFLSQNGKVRAELLIIRQFQMNGTIHLSIRHQLTDGKQKPSFTYEVIICSETVISASSIGPLKRLWPGSLAACRHQKGILASSKVRGVCVLKKGLFTKGPSHFLVLFCLEAQFQIFQQSFPSPFSLTCTALNLTIWSFVVCCLNISMC